MTINIITFAISLCAVIAILYSYRIEKLLRSSTKSDLTEERVVIKLDANRARVEGTTDYRYSVSR